MRATSQRWRIRVATCVAAIVALVSLPSPAPATSAPSLGRTIALNLARGPKDAGYAVVAYTPAVPGRDTTDPLSSFGGERLWKQQLPGTAAVTGRATSSSAASARFGGGGTTLGFAFAKAPSGLNALTIAAAGTTVTSNLAAGGATWEWTDAAGVQYLNHYDLGRELQAAFFMHTADGRLVNPTEAGDAYSDPALVADQRHTSPLASAANLSQSRQVTSAIPLEWWPHVVDPIGGAAHPVLYSDVRIGKDLQLGYGNRANVARYDTVLALPAPAQAAALEAPTAYLRPAFSSIIGFDARTGEVDVLSPQPFDTVGVDWVPRSGWGALVASDPSGAHAFAIYGVTQGQGGSITNFTAHDFTVRGGAGGAGDFSTVKLRAQRMGNFAAGVTRTTAYIVTGSLASVKADVAALAASGTR